MLRDPRLEALERRFYALKQARTKAGHSSALGLHLSPAEHEAFARLFAYEHPFQASVSLPFAIPVYQTAKASGYIEGYAPEYALAQMAGGYRGLGRGLLDRMNWR
jgi:hypothetical protein